MSSSPPIRSRPSRPAPVVPDYVLERLIGRGSYGDVWLARNTALGTHRALKVVYRDGFDSERPYLREFNGIRQFEPVSTHETQVSVFHVGKSDEAGYFYYVMELADDAATLGQVPPESPAAVPLPRDLAHYSPATLAALLQQRERLPGTEALPLALALADALAHLHAHGLVHRDVKPSNVVFVNGRAKLADIGLVTHAAGADTLVGTLGYIPPEGPGAPPADIYSLGKVLYEVVTGLDRQEFPNLPDDLAELPDRELLLEFNEIILKCCHMDPRARYADGAELLADVQRLHAGRSLRRERAGRRKLTVIASAAVVIGAALLWGKFQSARQPEPGQPEEVRPQVNYSLAPELPPPTDFWTNSLGMAFVAVPGLPVEFALWETRVRDYEIFAVATLRPAALGRSSVKGNTNSITWRRPGLNSAKSDQPVRVVTWDDAVAFCRWLTERERAAGLLRDGEIYRLPTDREWSWAAGLREEVGRTPLERHNAGRGDLLFFWGRAWPPPSRAGNFADTSSPMIERVAGYEDGFAIVSPVGAFPAERHGLFDLAGNVSEWCVDELPEESGNQRLSRGSSYSSGAAESFRVSRRIFDPRDAAYWDVGFRVVLETAPKAVAPRPVTGRPAPVPEATLTGTNSLGMRFVAVPGITAAFCVWETRVRDFQAFFEATGHKTDDAVFVGTSASGKSVPQHRHWLDKAVSAEPEWPVRAISARDARAFCAWLTRQEHAAGLLPTNLCYRLPRDAEWSRAAGLPDDAALPSNPPYRFYWGTNWPPPLNAGNFSGSESVMSASRRIAEFRDDFPTAAPVGSFPPEAHGLFDLAGNVSELCEPDTVESAGDKAPQVIRRGSSWDLYKPEHFDWRHRRTTLATYASVHTGFRIVRAPVDAAAGEAK